MVIVTRILCLLLGHKVRVITGFRNEDGAPIVCCKRCYVELVWPKYQASRHIMQELYGDGQWSSREYSEV